MNPGRAMPNRLARFLALAVVVFATAIPAASVSASQFTVFVGSPLSRTFPMPKRVNGRVGIGGDTPALIQLFGAGGVLFFSQNFFPGQVCDLQSPILATRVTITAHTPPPGTRVIICVDRRRPATVTIELGLTAVCSGGLEFYRQIATCPVTDSPRFRVKNEADCQVQIVAWIATGVDCMGPLREEIRATLAPNSPETPVDYFDRVRAWELRWLGGTASDHAVKLRWVD